MARRTMTVHPHGTQNGAQGRIAVELQDEIDEPTQTTATGLTRLAATLSDLLREQAIDSRFGTKLFKRLEKEAKRVIDHAPASLNKADKAALREALESLEHALVQRDAALLVAANARLRDSEEATAKRRKGKKDDV
ncbi:hypothetical protein AWB65_00767 [Caballeronia humi]|uniref:Uncharacterized protein n=2 Tax=Caballeronia humi TaxID=326474 RepID=A0A158FC98_9BURK|nr:hypothetical protein AWB65_00767 [Caballeronia humi]